MKTFIALASMSEEPCVCMEKSHEEGHRCTKARMRWANSSTFKVELTSKW